jgi:hypothetical protein
MIKLLNGFCIRGSQKYVVYEPKLRGRGVLSANEYSCAHGAQINFGDLTPLTYMLNILQTLLRKQENSSVLEKKEHI